MERCLCRQHYCNWGIDAASLDISGNADIDGTLETDNLTIGGAQGSDGQVLTSTGSGVGWENAAAGVLAVCKFYLQ